MPAILAKVNTHETVAEVVSPPDPAKPQPTCSLARRLHSLAMGHVWQSCWRGTLVIVPLTSPRPDKYYEVEAMFVNRTLCSLCCVPRQQAGRPGAAPPLDGVRLTARLAFGEGANRSCVRLSAKSKRGVP